MGFHIGPRVVKALAEVFIELVTSGYIIILINMLQMD